MAQQQQNITLSAPGFSGINTQDSPINMDPSFAAVASNCVIDNFGRIANRRGIQYMTSNPSVLAGNPITALKEFQTAAGASYLFATGNKKLFTQQTSTPFELVELTLPVGYSITGDNWKIVSLNDKAFFVQGAHAPLVFDPSVSTTAVAEWAELPPESAAGTSYPNEAHVAFGRLWLADFDLSKTQVAWSGLLNGENWTTDGTGSLVTEEFWPGGYDRVTSIAAHNNFLCIFGQRNILVYTTDSDPTSNIALSDTIEGIGSIARDSTVPTGQDYLFVDATGVRSLNRTIQEKSVPIGDLSRNVRDDFQTALSNEPEDDIRGLYLVDDDFYAVFLPGNPITYVFDTWNPLPDRSARTTTWTGNPLRCGTRTFSRDTYLGGVGGVFYYRGASDITLAVDDETETIASINIEYKTHPLDFGAPANLLFPKQADVTIFGGLTGNLNINWSFDFKQTGSRIQKTLGEESPVVLWGAAPNNGGSEWGGDGVVGKWTVGENLQQLRYNLWGSGRNISLSFDASVAGSIMSIQQIDLQVLQGRIL